MGGGGGRASGWGRRNEVKGLERFIWFVLVWGYYIVQILWACSIEAGAADEGLEGHMSNWRVSGMCGPA